MNEEMRNNLAINHMRKQESSNELVSIIKLLYSLGWRMVRDGRELESAESVLIEYIDSLE